MVLWNKFTDEEMRSRPKVRCYVNLVKTKKDDEYGVFSIKHKGRVKAHAYFIKLVDCKFCVSEASRQRAIVHNTRNVHAWVEGYLVFYEQKPRMGDGQYKHIVSYNPFKWPKFRDVRTGEDVESGSEVLLFKRAAHIIG